jgi:DNA-binding HxlR family transcriptional regulator
MQRTDFSAMVCSIARSVAVAGEPWSPLVLRDVWVGINRFDDPTRSARRGTSTS